MGLKMPNISLSVDLSRTRIKLGQPENSVTFPTRWLANRASCAVQNPQRSNWAPENQISSRLYEILNSLSQDVRPDLRWIAEANAMTPRTLQRRLADEGTTYFEILDAWRFERALNLLQSTAKSVTEIAEEIGYADAAHFRRAFHRWTSATPSSYRDSLSNI